MDTRADSIVHIGRWSEKLGFVLPAALTNPYCLAGNAYPIKARHRS